MKKQILFWFVILALEGLPSSGNIDALYYLLSIHFFPENYRTFVHCKIYNLSLQLPVSSCQTVIVYDVLGNEIATLVDEYSTAGSYEVEFNAESSIKNLASGIYFYRLTCGDFVQTKKMILMR